METIWVLMALLYAGEPSRLDLKVVEQIVTEYCVDCHDDDEPIRLSPLPNIKDHVSWRRIRTAVQSRRMPPEELLPMSELRTLAMAATRLSAVEPQRRPHQIPMLSGSEWLIVVRELAEPWMNGREFESIVALRQGLDPAVSRYFISADVCRAIIEREKTASDSERRWFLGIQNLTSLDGPEIEQLVQRISKDLYQQPFSQEASKNHVTRMRAYEKVTGARSEGLVALCVDMLDGLEIRVVGKVP